MDTAGLTARWDRAWGDWRPVSHELPVRGNERWTRFHSLPGSKRYAGNEDEYAEIYWTSVLTGINDPDDTWWHLWASPTRLHSQELSQLLRLVADNRTAGVIITTADMGWLYAPYDGGADVIAATADHRNQLHRAHKDWLSDHPAGL